MALYAHLERAREEASCIARGPLIGMDQPSGSGLTYTLQTHPSTGMSHGLDVTIMTRYREDHLSSLAISVTDLNEDSEIALEDTITLLGHVKEKNSARLTVMDSRGRESFSMNWAKRLPHLYSWHTHNGEDEDIAREIAGIMHGDQRQLGRYVLGQLPDEVRVLSALDNLKVPNEYHVESGGVFGLVRRSGHRRARTAVGMGYTAGGYVHYTLIEERPRGSLPRKEVDRLEPLLDNLLGEDIVQLHYRMRGAERR